jgi:hypothetical protein
MIPPPSLAGLGEESQFVVLAQAGSAALLGIGKVPRENLGVFWSPACQQLTLNTGLIWGLIIAL